MAKRSPSSSPTRLIREILHVPTGERRRTDDGWLDTMPDDEFVRVRRRATTARNSGASEWACAACGHPAFPSRHHLTRLRHFRHFAGAPADCPWHQDDGFDLAELDMLRFGGQDEGARHREVKRFLMHMTSVDPRFSPPDVANYDPYKEHWVTAANGERRRPDVYRRLHGNPVVFEIQLARTYLRTIQGRETFYQDQGIRLAWVFWEFEKVCNHLSAQDICHFNRSNALSLDPEAVEQSLSTGRLQFRVWWWEHVLDSWGKPGRVWRERFVDVDELLWDPESGLPYLVDPEAMRMAAVEERKAAEARRVAALADGVAAIWALDEANHPWIGTDGAYDYEAQERLPQNPWVALARHVGCAIDWDTARRRLGCWSVLPLLYAIRDGRGYGRMNLAAVVMNLLEHRRWATHVVVAVTRAYGRQHVLDDRPKAATKVRRNIREAYRRVSDSMPVRDLDGMLAILFPEAAENIRKPWPPMAAQEYLRGKAAD
ncbi:hypothetical protein FBZ82_10163 [Azospirillum brasilense]|uniref:DUF6035 domain-containing protein n=1 Tax=Azospirillum brasilense TaxID=192 RepID=A0A560BN50_AZOBR|nr:DUF6035 family protein [Azospirillum brasilense]TWA74050.1 hypothetical protein FBZ82_10163 [Azospirillum brasilense]